MVRRFFASAALVALAMTAGACIGGPQTDPPGDRYSDSDAGAPRDLGSVDAETVRFGSDGSAPNDAGAPDGGSAGLFDTDTANPGIPGDHKISTIILPPPWKYTSPDAGPTDGARD